MVRKSQMELGGVRKRLGRIGTSWEESERSQEQSGRGCEDVRKRSGMIGQSWEEVRSRS